MNVTLVHYSILGGISNTAEKFKYNSSHMENYIPSNDKIVILARHFYRTDDMWKIQRFIETNKGKIIGVIIIDDKNFGEFYGDCASFFTSRDLPILALVDRIIGKKVILELEELIDEKI